MLYYCSRTASENGEVINDRRKSDPASYITTPRMSWDALPLKTGVEVELITNSEYLPVVDGMKRGRLTIVGTEHFVETSKLRLPLEILVLH